MRNRAVIQQRDRAPTCSARRVGKRTVVTIGDKLIVLSHPNLPMPHFTRYVRALRDNEQRVMNRVPAQH